MATLYNGVPKPRQQPAPGASPKGGTTSLPQHLKSVNPRANVGVQSGLLSGMQKLSAAAPGAATTTGVGNFQQFPSGKPTRGPEAGAIPGPAAPPPASMPQGTVPPPPPAAPTTTSAPPAGREDRVDAPPVSAPADPQQEMGDELFAQLMEMLKNPSRYGSEQAEATRKQGFANLDDERRLAEDRATADAASRGVYYGSPLTNSLGDIGERYLRGGADLETNIQRDQAAQFQQDRQSALDMIFRYGAEQRLDERQMNELLLEWARYGSQGGPTI